MLTFTKPCVLHTADFCDLLAGSALPNQGNGIRVGHSAKNFYQTDGNYREFLRKRETQLFMYLDESRQDITVVAVRRILQLIQKLGLLVNVLKSNMNPLQVLYLKSVLNTRMSVFPSDERYK